MKIKRYHRALGLPAVQLPNQTVRLHYGDHARQAALTDRYGVPSKLPLQLWLRPEDVFEVETERRWTRRGPKVAPALHEDCLTKLVVRLSSGFISPTPGVDLILVLRADSDGVFSRVVTLWFNLKSDAHVTLDAGLYDKP